jgi:hypothetical protein
LEQREITYNYYKYNKKSKKNGIPGAYSMCGFAIMRTDIRNAALRKQHEDKKYYDHFGMVFVSG